jgi:beta-lactamase regulating signal transducer with metallopeptidase domain
VDAALNWLWQGCVVAVTLSVALRLLERARANVRYIVCWAALLLILVLPAFAWLGTNATWPDAVASGSASAVLSVPDTWWTSSAVMVAAWMVWASVYLVRFVWAMVALRRARKSSHSFPSHVESSLFHWRQVRSTGRRPVLVLSDSVPTAAVLGCGSPVIAVAPSMLATLDADELDRVLIHEWAHVQRRDDLVHIAQIVIRVVAGWHPAVWWIERRLHVEREIACDEMTVAVTGSPKSYAECLVKLASLRGAVPTALAGPAMLTASGLRLRVTRIVSRHVLIAPYWSRGIAIGIVSALCVVSLTVGGLRLVEVTAFAVPLEAVPFESVRMVNVSFPAIAPVAVSMLNSQHFGSPHLPRQSAASAPSTPPSAAEDRVPVASAPDEKEQIAAEVPRAVDSTVPQTTAARDADTEAAHEPSVHVPPTQAPDVVVEQTRSPWMEVADGGAALGRKSKDAGLATAGFFTRFARRVAGSF